MTQNNVIAFPLTKIQSKPATELADVPNKDSKSIEDIQYRSAVTIAQENSLAHTFNALKYLPESPKKIIELVEADGIHRIPHCIYEFMFKATKSRPELIVLACLIRFTSGFHRPNCEASLRFISKWAGISVTSARKGIAPLLAKKIIVCLKVGKSAEDPSIYEVLVVKGYLEFLKSAQQPSYKSNEEQPEKSKQKEHDRPCTQSVRSKLSPYIQGERNSTPTMHGTVHPVCTKKENSNENLNETLSPKKQSESNLENNQNSINAYFASLFSKGKRISEIKHFDSFKHFYKHEDLVYLLTYIQTKGVPGTGEPVHSPMAFLARSITNVMPLVLAERDRAQKRMKREKEEAVMEQRKAQEEAEAEAKDEITFIEAMGMFHKAFPSIELQQKAIQNFAERFPMFKENAFALREATIREWAATQRNISSKPTNSNS